MKNLKGVTKIIEDLSNDHEKAAAIFSLILNSENGMIKQQAGDLWITLVLLYGDLITKEFAKITRKRNRDERKMEKLIEENVELRRELERKNNRDNYWVGEKDRMRVVKQYDWDVNVVKIQSDWTNKNVKFDKDEYPF